ncbi:MAG: aminotransferase class III-fold pyridoxal phosphate-dependent enzyme [Rhodospirillaceae bacterium]|jgi:beta-alanine--pyruvate transaminase|nr:aminotransferase class III-fold pyridoxal phosphate-dependent enzyme [Rhodospirillaceae bacterium]
MTTNTLEHHWMPFTANRDFKADPRILVAAKGMHYTNHHGERVIDASSGLFCCAAGHGRKEIADAVAAQLMELDYSPPFQYGSAPAFELARRVAALTPGTLNRVFFTNSGSESIDTALKIAMAWHTARGEGHRDKYISRERAYHGVNIGGTSLSGLMKNREVFGAVMPGVAHLRHTWLDENRFSRGQPPHGADLAEDLQRFVDMYGGRNIAACFVEPVAGSTGCLVPPVGYLERLREICDAHGILLIFDEVITGFGRLGHPFAADAFGVMPDIMTLAKALTNGVMPMGAVAVSETIYDTINEAAPDGAMEFFHGYTYSGNPASSAAGIAALDIYENENLFGRAADLSKPFLDMLFGLKDLDCISDIRGYGLLGAIDLAPGSGAEMLKKLYAAGLYVKFTGDTALLAPAFIAGQDDIDEIGGILRDVL